jgi:hypothetical protein
MPHQIGGAFLFALLFTMMAIMLPLSFPYGGFKVEMRAAKP